MANYRILHRLMVVSLLAMVGFLGGCPFLIHRDPVRPPSIVDIQDVWLGPSSRGEVWQIELNRDGTGSVAVTGTLPVIGIETENPKVEHLRVRSWRLNGFDIEILTDAPRLMDVPTLKFVGRVSRSTLDLHYKSKYWERTMVLKRKPEFEQAMRDLASEETGK